MLEVLALEAGREGAEVARGELPVRGEVAGDQAAGEDSVGGDADAQFADGRQDLLLDAAGDQGVLDLEVRDRRGRGGSADGVGADLAEADVPDVPLFDQFGNGADGLLDGDGRVEAGEPVHVDVVDAEALERVRGEVLHGLRQAVDAQPGAVGAAQRAELHADQRLFAAGCGGGAQGFGEEQFVVAHAVEVAGVEQGDAGFEGRVDGGDGLGAVGVAVQRGHAHAAEGEGGDLGAGGSEGAGLDRRHASTFA
ncbi:hypothetical protein SGLAM104S_03786 [Streptomyces glaucescens]